MSLSIATLNKSEAAHYLHTLHEEFIVKFELEDEHPDFYSTINENVRSPLTPDAIERGYYRGNRGVIGVIPHLRRGKKVAFYKSLLKDWFVGHYAPKLLLAKAA